MGTHVHHRRSARRPRGLWPAAALALACLAHAASGRVLYQEEPAAAADPGAEAFGVRAPVADLGLLENVATDETIPCTKAAVCDGAWAQAAAATVSVYVQRHTVLEGQAATEAGACTGTLVRGPDPSKLYVISAVHCFSNRTDAEQFKQWALVFNWDAAACAQPPTKPELVDEVDVLYRALKPVFIDEVSDVLLLEVTAPVPASFGAQALQVQPSAVPPRDAVVVHHPIGSYKHISYANSSLAPGGVAVEGLPGTEFLEKQLVRVGPADHWKVQWTDGVTQGGSSGSALIDAATGNVVGVLSGGSSTCAGPDEDRYDFFGRVDAAWDQGLSQFFSDSPPEDVTADEVVGQVTQVAAASGVNASPLAFVLSAAAPAQQVLVWWGDPIPAGDTVRVRASYEVVPSRGSDGAGLSASDVVVAPGELEFSAQGVVAADGMDVENSQPLTVSIAPGATLPDGTVVFITLEPVDAAGAPLPGVELLRFKALVAAWTLNDTVDDQPAIPAQLPYSEEAPLESPEGRAIWKYVAPTDTAVDVTVCAAANVSATALTVYDQEAEAGPITAVGDGSHDPEGDGCIGIQGLPLTGGRSYYFVLSDNDLLLYALPLDDVFSFSLVPAEDQGGGSSSAAAAAAPARR